MYLYIGLHGFPAAHKMIITPIHLILAPELKIYSEIWHYTFFPTWASYMYVLILIPWCIAIACCASYFLLMM